MPGKNWKTLNIKTAEGIELLKTLVCKFDVLVENFRPDTLRKLGLERPWMNGRSTEKPDVL